MKAVTIFCEECRKPVAYTVKTMPMTATIEGREYHYMGQEASCNDCGEPVYVPEIVDANLRALYDVYREENGIISLDKVRALPEKYRIGKGTLSLLLGWEEKTFSRYYDGDVPTKEHSDMMKRLGEDPQFYSGLLEKSNESKAERHIA